jgi:hypothetical protein
MRAKPPDYRIEAIKELLGAGLEKEIGARNGLS